MFQGDTRLYCRRNSRHLVPRNPAWKPLPWNKFAVACISHLGEQRQPLFPTKSATLVLVMAHVVDWQRQPNYFDAVTLQKTLIKVSLNESDNNIRVFVAPDPCDELAKPLSGWCPELQLMFVLSTPVEWTLAPSASRRRSSAPSSATVSSRQRSVSAPADDPADAFVSAGAAALRLKQQEK